MKDIYFAYFMGALCIFTAVAYGVRVMLRGVVHSDRVARIGGTALVGRGVMDTTYWLLDPIVRGAAALSITPNMLTWGALVLGLAAGVAIGYGWFGLSCVLATSSTFCDILDGQVARLTKSGSNRGELLDAAIDRYTEFAYLGGLLIYFRESVPLMLLVLAATIASYMISYASAKAEALQVSPPRGLMRRHERSIYLITAAGFTPICGPWMHAHWDIPWYSLEIFALAMVAVVGNFAAIQRFVRIARSLG